MQNTLETLRLENVWHCQIGNQNKNLTAWLRPLRRETVEKKFLRSFNIQKTTKMHGA